MWTWRSFSLDSSAIAVVSPPSRMLYPYSRIFDLYFLIKNTNEYKAFKTKARGGYPEVDFGKQMLVVLESEGALPDKVFEIDSAEVQDGKLLVKYRVNVFGLDEKTNTHTVFSVAKTDLPVELKQIF